jgi:hypothetical protein
VPSQPLTPPEKLARLKRWVVVLGVALIVTGAIILFVLRRVPLPLRIMAGLGDAFIGAVLLVMAARRS